MTNQDIIAILGQVHHPGKGDKSLIELGMVEDIEIKENGVVVTLAFPKKRDPLADYLVGSTKANLVKIFPEGSDIEVKTIVKEDDAPKKKLEMCDDGIEQVKHIIGIASGKGGVGKSTVAVNLAIALSRLGYKVGLADADVYGPSVPTMTDTEGQIPDGEIDRQGRQWILPIEKYGVKWISIGYFAERGKALIWRGPMACNALKQLLMQVSWGELDFLLIDMPPGTGDIHISLVQDIPMSGAVIVTTPQNVALADVEKGVNMFRNPSINKPIYGLVENMAWFTPAELPENKYYIFGKDGGVNMAKELGIDLIGQIPLVQSIREGGDSGEPSALGTSVESAAFLQLAERLAEIVG